MPRLCANLSMMYADAPFLERFGLAAASGFDAVEFLFPYDHPAADLRSRLDANGLTQVLFNGPPGDWNAGERGLASLPGRQSEFRDGIDRALDYAAALGCAMVHVMAGIPPAGVPHVEAAAVYAANLAWAAERAGPRNVRLTIEPINHRDMPGFHLNSMAQGAAVVAAIGASRIGLQFDVYHCQVTEGDISMRLARHMPIIAHIQIADVPGRHEPGTGEIGWAHVFSEIDRLGYQGHVGCEYRPRGDTNQGLRWRSVFELR